MNHPSAGITGRGSHTLWTVLLAWNKDKNIIFVGGWWGGYLADFSVSMLSCDTDSLAPHFRVCAPHRSGQP